MHSPEQGLIAYLNEIKDKTIGFVELQTSLSEPHIDFHLDARYSLFSSQCIFDNCSDVQVKLFLESFLTKNLSVGWSVSEQLSKLLSKRGHLVSEIIDPLLRTLDWKSCSTHLLFLSYLALRNDGDSMALKLLDDVPEDGRDGLFLACYRLHSKELDQKLMKKFLVWESDGWSPSSTGELYALEKFIAKWIKIYPYQDLEGVIRLYFNHCRED